MRGGILTNFSFPVEIYRGGSQAPQWLQRHLPQIRRWQSRDLLSSDGIAGELALVEHGLERDVSDIPVLPALATGRGYHRR